MYIEPLHGEGMISSMALDNCLVTSSVHPIWQRNLMVDAVKAQNG